MEDTKLKTFEDLEKEFHKLVQERSSYDIIKPNMTLIISLEGRDGIVIASDSRVTTGDAHYRDDSDKKLDKISDHIGLATAGDALLVEALIKELKDVVNVDPNLQNSVTLTAEKFRQILYNKYILWFPIGMLNGQPRPELLFILSGYDIFTDRQEQKTFVLISNLNFVPLPQMNGCGLGGQINYARGLVTRFYSQTKNINDLAKLAIYAVTETAKQNIFVGGKTRLMKIKNTGIEFLSDADISTIERENKRRERHIQEHFFTEEN